MAGKGKRTGQAFKRYALSQVVAMQSAQQEIVFSGTRDAKEKPLTIDTPITDYDRRFDRRYARGIHEMLHAMARERAERTGTAPRKAFRDISDGFANTFDLGPNGTVYLLAAARLRGIKARTAEAGSELVKGFLERIQAERLEPDARFNAVWRKWDQALHLLQIHLPCNGEEKIGGAHMLLGLDLWHRTDANVAPCHALRAIHAANARGIDLEVFSAFAREQGAARLNDIARLVTDGLITAENIWEFQTRPDLVRALNHAQLDWLIRAWLKEPTTELMAFARERRKALRALRVPNAAKPCPTPIAELSLSAALEWSFQNASPEESRRNGRAYAPRLHVHRCPASEANPGQYAPLDDHVLGTDVTPELLEGVAARLSLSGEALARQAERVQVLFGENTPCTHVLFALDLLAAWMGRIPPGLCLRAALASRRARIPDSLALDLYHQFGQEDAAEAVGLIEDGLIATKECVRLLRYPWIVTRNRGRMRAFLTQYRSCHSPADIASHAIAARPA